MAVVLQKIKYLKINDILPNPYQVRKNFDRQALFRLAESIKENGILSPIVVRGGIKGYELICGQRRLRAAVIAGLKEVPAVVIKAGDAQCAYLSLAENTQRVDLEYSEEAEGYYNLLSYHHMKKDSVVKKLATDVTHISEKIRILSLSDKVRYKLEEKGLSEQYARELLKLHDEYRQLDIIDKIAAEDLTCSETAALVRKELRMMGRENSRRNKFTHIKGDASLTMPIYINTVNKTLDMLKKSGAKISVSESENEDYSEFVLRIHKK